MSTSAATSDGVRGRQPTTYWFTACQFVVRTEAEGHPRQAASRAHAKEMGTTLTACGLEATSWHRLWEVPFAVAKVKDRCPQCVAICAEARPSDRGSVLARAHGQSRSRPEARDDPQATNQRSGVRPLGAPARPDGRADRRSREATDWEPSPEWDSRPRTRDVPADVQTTQGDSR